MFKKIAIIGASRGLGRALALGIPKFFEGRKPQILLVSRKADLLHAVQNELTPYAPTSLQICDLANADEVENLAEMVRTFDMVIYNAGGGPHGDYSQKAWKDHQWALQVCLSSPMRLCHSWLQEKHGQSACFLIVGSRIAGLQPDPFAVSYAAAKHGLVGFVGSLQAELQGQQKRVCLFSPGYMDTDLLPHSAEIRMQGRKIMAPEAAAAACWRWILAENQHNAWHRVLN